MGFTSDICNNCTQNTIDTHTHAFWHCTPIFQFWKNITTALTTFFGCDIPMCPSLCILGNTSSINLDQHAKQILLVALTIAKKTILMNWKTRHKTNINLWKNLLLDYITLDNTPITTTTHNTEPTSLWSQLLTFLQ